MIVDSNVHTDQTQNTASTTANVLHVLPDVPDVSGLFLYNLYSLYNLWRQAGQCCLQARQPGHPLPLRATLIMTPPPQHCRHFQPLDMPTGEPPACLE